MSANPALTWVLLGDLQLVCVDLRRADDPDPVAHLRRQARQAIFAASATAPVYLALLEQHEVSAAGIPAEVLNDIDIGALLADEDFSFDGHGGAVWFLAEAYLRSPFTTEAQKAAIVRIRDTFVPSLAELRKSYPDEAAASVARQKLIEGLAADLDLFPVIGGTLRRWVEAQVQAGLNIEGLLARKGLAEQIDRRKLRELRGAILATLGRFRQALADEVALGRLPADADSLVFGYLDLLAANREKAALSRAARTATSALPT